MLGQISKLRHAAVVGAVGICTLLTATGVIGSSYPERYDSWQSVVQPAGAGGVRIIDTFDQDFGSNERRGPERFIANDFGAPVDIEVSSPSAPDDVSVTDFGIDTRVRVGEVSTFVSGQHRYRFAYTLPDAKLGGGVLSLDVLSADGPEIGRFELIVTGFVLDDPRCFSGVAGSTDECEWVEQRDGYYRAVIEPLGADRGVTVEGDVVDTIAPEAVEPPPLPERRTERRGLLTAAVAGLGSLGAFGVYRWSRHRGRNEVFAGGAVEAAFGSLPPPTADGAPPPVQLVADDDLGELATIEFVPPKGLAPWEGAVLMRERIGDDAVEAWLSGLAGAEVIELSEDDDEMVISSGPKRAQLTEPDASLLTLLLQGRDEYTTGKYDAKFAAAWKAIERSQRERIAGSGWWKHLPPGSGLGVRSGVSAYALIMFGVFFFVWAGSAATIVLGLFGSWVAALAIGLVLPATVAFFVYRVLRPARSATGSARALQTESFRRFLHASEGQHVDWAWSQGLVREYSGWAVALDEADAWSKALAASNVPAPARPSMMGPVIVARRGSAIRTTRTPPSSSGSGGSGGFRGGSVGGGGGGGSRGSW